MTVPVIQVERFSYAPDCTLSVVSVAGTQFECYGIELPWLDNRKGKSCIPVGEYSAKIGLHGTNRRGGPAESIELTSVPGRTEIEIHVANRPSELLGCIAIGRRLGVLAGERAVLASVAAMRGLLVTLGGLGLDFGAAVTVRVSDNLTRFRHFPALAGLPG